MTEPGYSIRPLATQAELETCAALQREIWGISPSDSMSTITMHALTMSYPTTGLLLGGFFGEEMVGLVVVLAALEPRTAYGHMLGVRDSHRDSGLGGRLSQEAIRRFRERGGRFYCFTFDPLESRNSHLYLNRHGAAGIRFERDAYGTSGAFHGGLPMDRLLARIDLDAPPPPPPPSLDDALRLYPVATPERMPDAEAVLAEIPADIGALRETDHDAALAASRSLRVLLDRYVTRGGLASCALVRGEQGGAPRSFHLLRRVAEPEP